MNYLSLIFATTVNRRAGAPLERMLKEEPHHFPGRVRSSRIGIGARRAASCPRVSGSVNIPMLQDFAPAGVGKDCAGIGVAAGRPSAMHLLLRARRSQRLDKNIIAVAWVHRHVTIAMKYDGRNS